MLTDKQIKQRWTDIKKTIKGRPLLAYIVGIPYQNWITYMNSTPIEAEVNRIYDAIKDDRASKTLRVKSKLQKIVGYREARLFSKKIGISDATIRDILEDKKLVAGYDVLDRLEVFINVLDPEFEPSLENMLNKEKIVRDEFDVIVAEVRSVSNGLMREAFELTDVARHMKAQTDWRGASTQPSDGLNNFITRLTKIRDEVDLLYTTYINSGK